MIKSTLCYIEKNGCYLMLFRNKKENDPCEGKWVGIGGKFEPGENAEQCLLREVWEETGLTLTEYRFHGIIHFESDVLEDEDMYLFTATEFSGMDPVTGEDKASSSGDDEARKSVAMEDTPDEDTHDAPEEEIAVMTPAEQFYCNEGDLKWIPKERVTSLNLWEGDRYFLEPLIAGADQIEMTCVYQGDHLVSVV